MGEYTYTATKDFEGKWSVTLSNSTTGQTIDTTSGLRSARAVKKWVQTAAEHDKWINSSPDVHTERHVLNGAVSV